MIKKTKSSPNLSPKAILTQGRPKSELVNVSKGLSLAHIYELRFGSFHGPRGAYRALTPGPAKCLLEQIPGAVTNSLCVGLGPYEASDWLKSGGRGRVAAKALRIFTPRPFGLGQACGVNIRA